jgi:hypothetical protein
MSPRIIRYPHCRNMPRMPNDTTTDRLIPFRDVARLQWLPRRRNGAKLSLTTLWRWSTRGVRGVVLRTVRVGETPCTTENWLREFFEALASERREIAPTNGVRTPAQRNREITTATKLLSAAGI